MYDTFSCCANANTWFMVLGMSNEDFIKVVERFAALHNMSDTGVSRFLSGSPNFLDRLRKGGGLLTHTEARLRDKMNQHNIKTGANT